MNASHPAPPVSLFLSNRLMNRAPMAAQWTCTIWKMMIVMTVSSQRPIGSRPLQVPDIPVVLTSPGLSYEATLQGDKSSWYIKCIAVLLPWGGDGGSLDWEHSSCTWKFTPTFTSSHISHRLLPVKGWAWQGCINHVHVWSISYKDSFKCKEN